MRIKNSIINIIAGCLMYLVIMLGSFFTRQVFKSVLGMQFVGIDSLFLNIVSSLSIIELGLGTGMIYKLYRPIAEKNWQMIASILNFLRKAYIYIEVFILIFGIMLSFYVGNFIKEDFSKLWLGEIFILYVLDTMASYLYSHKRNMIMADQKNYINNTIHSMMQIILLITQFFVLKLFCSFEIYLISKIVMRVAEGIIISSQFDRRYPELSLKNCNKLSNIERKDFFRNIKALLIHKISASILSPAYNLMITYFIGLEQNGIYSNYMLIVTALHSITNEIFNGILASFGNLLNTEVKEKAYQNFRILYLLNFFIYSFITTAYFNLVTPFMKLWMGNQSTFDIFTTICITAYLYIYGMRQSIMMVKNVAGIYDPDKYWGLLGSIISLATSIILVDSLKIGGLLIGSMFGLIILPCWMHPYLVYNTVFKKSSKNYQLKYILYTSLTVLYIFITSYICSFGHYVGITKIIFNLVISIIVPNVLNVIAFYKTKDFQLILKYTFNLKNYFKIKNTP